MQGKLCAVVVIIVAVGTLSLGQYRRQDPRQHGLAPRSRLAKKDHGSWYRYYPSSKPRVCRIQPCCLKLLKTIKTDCFLFIPFVAGILSYWFAFGYTRINPICSSSVTQNVTATATATQAATATLTATATVAQTITTTTTSTLYDITLVTVTQTDTSSVFTTPMTTTTVLTTVATDTVISTRTDFSQSCGMQGKRGLYRRIMFTALPKADFNQRPLTDSSRVEHYSFLDVFPSFS